MSFKNWYIVGGILLVLVLEVFIIQAVWSLHTNPDKEVGLKALAWLFPIIFPVFCFTVLYVKIKEGESKGLW